MKKYLINNAPFMYSCRKLQIKAQLSYRNFKLKPDLTLNDLIKLAGEY